MDACGSLDAIVELTQILTWAAVAMRASNKGVLQYSVSELMFYMTPCASLSPLYHFFIGVDSIPLLDNEKSY